MCECGCTSNNQVFKLKAPDGWYVIELIPGCNYCSAAPSIQICHPESINPMDFGFDTIEGMEEISDLPVIGRGEYCISIIKCGPDPDEVKRAAVKCFDGSETENNHVDKVLAEIFGEDLWKDSLSDSPSVIFPNKEKRSGYAKN